MLFKVNFDEKVKRRQSQPFSEEHRLKLRVWQFAIVMLQLLDRKVYTPEFREARVKLGYTDMVQYVND